MADNLTAANTSNLQSTSPHRSRAKRRSDPFDHIPQLSPSPSPGNAQHGGHSDEDEGSSDTLLTKLFISPLIFTSFLISLLIVDRRDRAWRARQHPAASLWARFSNWIDPEPYQDPVDATWRKDEGAADARNPAVDAQPVRKNQAREKKGWFRQKKHRKMAKYEFEDAFALRQSVAAWIFGVGLLLMGAGTYAVKGFFGWRFW